MTLHYNGMAWPDGGWRLAHLLTRPPLQAEYHPKHIVYRVNRYSRLFERPTHLLRAFLCSLRYVANLELQLECEVDGDVRDCKEIGAEVMPRLAANQGMKEPPPLLLSIEAEASAVWQFNMYGEDKYRSQYGR